METPFAELLGKSSFSFLEGASHPDEIVQAAHTLRLAALAVCDRNGLYGSVRVHTEAKQLEQRVIVGAELSLEGDPELGPASVALLAIDHEGYENLCALLTEAHAECEKGTAAISPERIASRHRGLFAIVPLEGRALFDEYAEALFAPLCDAFGERIFTAAWRHKDSFDAARVARAHALHRRYGIETIATARPLYHTAERKPLADILSTIRHRTTLDRAGSLLPPNAEARLRSGGQMLAIFGDHPAWVHRTVEIASACRFSLDELRYRFPSDALCREGESPDMALRRAVEEGCAIRYPQGTPSAVWTQIEKELTLIQKLEVAPYFLSVQQIVHMARERRILCQGRGSAANSAVCFVLGVTAVDPARSNLLFERFLSEERHEPPDIDVDFEHERREEIIQAIYEEHGRDRAAMVSEIISYRGKSAIREVGKVFGLSLDQVDRLSGLVMHMDAEGLSDRRIEESGLDPSDDRLREVVLRASELEGFPRHLSIHVGGFVISAESLARVAPVEPARMEGRTVIPWDKDDIDDLGFFKIDVLALGMLTAIRKTLALIHAEGADPIESLARIPAEDPAVYEAVGRADTIGVFQIESRAQMAMLPRLRPRCFYDLVIEVALVRPGPIQGGMVHPYLRRRQGQEPAVAPHPCLEPILERTLGVPLFQEQVMQISMVGAGYSPGEADQLRRDMAAWKKHGRLERHRDQLLRGFALRGISASFGLMLYEQIKGFGEYGFPESHAASFALLVYASAWLKVHHPAEFACSLLNSQPMGFYSPSAIVQDAKRHGVEVLPVCALKSEWDSTLESGALRLGLRQVRGFGEGAARTLCGARAEKPFESLHDLIHRTSLRKNEIEALAEAGAFDALMPSRREALWKARAPREGGLFEGLAIERGGKVPLPPLRPLEQLSLDYGRVGLSVSDHPMRHLREDLERQGVITASGLRALRNGARVAVAGLVVGRQRPDTASGVTFITLEDETGMTNLIVPKRVFGENYAVARHARLMLAHGRLDREGEVIHVLARELSRLDLPDEGSVTVPSRDFH